MSRIIRTIEQNLREANKAYRAGEPTMSDTEYDELTAKLRELDPKNSFLNTVEPEAPLNDKNEVPHPSPMLSTEKAYPEADGEQKDLKRWINRCRDAFLAVHGSDSTMVFKTTPKLDGVAARKYMGGPLVTRGDGTKGSNITHLLIKGLVFTGKQRAPYANGEIVIPQEYFDRYLADAFAHPRNVVAGLCGSIEYNAHQQALLDTCNVHFVSYDDMEWHSTENDFTLVQTISSIYERYRQQCPYLLDGVVIEVIDPAVKTHIGSTNHHHRWMIAYKENDAGVTTKVRSVTWQTGRTGIVAPVLEVDEVNVSGAKIKRVTGHNVDYLREHGLGAGAEIRIVRSGDVIPKHVETIKPASEISSCSNCPTCGTQVEIDGPRYRCPKFTCGARVAGRIEHFFDTMGNCDGFGPSVVEAFVEGGAFDVGDVFDWDEAGHLDEVLDFGTKTKENLLKELQRCRSEQVEDWRFLAAIGIEGLGKGDAKKLIKHITIDEFIELEARTLIDLIEGIDGFGAIKAKKIMAGRQELHDMLSYLYLDLHFNLKRTELSSDDAKLAGKNIVFTGKMSKPRKEMEAMVEALGAVAQSSVSSKTHILVYGGNLGNSKRQAAEKHGTLLMSEEEFEAYVD